MPQPFLSLQEIGDRFNQVLDRDAQNRFIEQKKLELEEQKIQLEDKKLSNEAVVKQQQAKKLESERFNVCLLYTSPSPRD